jgi:hypothetical protein
LLERLSLELITALAPADVRRIIDVGGSSVLVDRLLDLRFDRIPVLDVSGTALSKASSRLGERASRVQWIVADITESESLGSQARASQAGTLLPLLRFPMEPVQPRR